jgi:glycosyltransferase involved in cell wall biosynthesis
MRVLEIGPYPPPHGGVQTNLVDIRNYLRKQGCSCEAINITRHRRADADGVYYPSNALELVRLLLRLRYDVVHLHIGGHLSGRLLALSLVCCLMPGSKAVLTFHSGGYPSSPAGKTAGPRTLRGWVMRRFDGVIAVNREIADLFGRCGVSAARVRLIPPHSVSPPGEETALPDELARFFVERQPRLIAVGLLEPEYDLPMQIDAMANVLERHPNAGLAILGSGSLEDMLRERIASKPYRDRILLCGDVAHQGALRAIARSDVVLRTTLYDGDSVAVREALALGTPVIATDNGMRPAGVRLIPAREPGKLLEAIEAELAAGGAHSRPAAGGEENLEAVVRFYRELRVGAKP